MSSSPSEPSSPSATAANDTSTKNLGVCTLFPAYLDMLTRTQQGDLAAALSGDFDYHGNFYFAEKLKETCNWKLDDPYEACRPKISIEGVGDVELPLEDPDTIRKIMECAVLAPFGKGEETVVDTSVRNTWQIDAAKVTIANNKWQERFEGEVLKKVCTGLGVDMDKTNPRLELYKLLLYTKGSQ